jgi:hypothetical protein
MFRHFRDFPRKDGHDTDSSRIASVGAAFCEDGLIGPKWVDRQPTGKRWQKRLLAAVLGVR